MSSLFGIAEKYDYLVSQIEENDGEVTEEVASELAITEQELEDKLRAYRKILDVKKLETEYNKEEIKRLRERNAGFDKATKRLKQAIVDALHVFGVQSKSGNFNLKFPDFTVYTKESQSINVNEDSLTDIINNQLLPDVYPIHPHSATLLINGKEYFDKIGNLTLSVNIKLSDLKDFAAYIRSKYGDDFVYKWSFDKKAIKELDEYAQGLASSENLNSEDEQKLKTISGIMDLIDMEICTSETAIFK